MLISSPVVTTDQLAASLSYSGYRRHIAEALAAAPPAPALAKMLPYYQQAEDRLNRLTTTVGVLPELQNALGQLTQQYIWAIITEGWCGDASHTVPIFEALAQASGGHLATRYFLRDSNLELIDRYLTNGGRAIPVAVLLRADTLTEAGVWGPRPAPLQAIYQELKARETPFKELVAQVNAWYDQDAAHTTQQELLVLLQKLVPSSF